MACGLVLLLLLLSSSSLVWVHANLLVHRIHRRTCTREQVVDVPRDYKSFYLQHDTKRPGSSSSGVEADQYGSVAAAASAAAAAAAAAAVIAEHRVPGRRKKKFVRVLNHRIRELQTVRQQQLQLQQQQRLLQQHNQTNADADDVGAGGDGAASSATKHRGSQLDGSGNASGSVANSSSLAAKQQQIQHAHALTISADNSLSDTTLSSTVLATSTTTASRLAHPALEGKDPLLATRFKQSDFNCFAGAKIFYGSMVAFEHLVSCAGAMYVATCDVQRATCDMEYERAALLPTCIHTLLLRRAFALHAPARHCSRRLPNTRTCMNRPSPRADVRGAPVVLPCTSEHHTPGWLCSDRTMSCVPTSS